ncbi:MAG: DUF4097 domain-containing protein [Treponema sp.]|jgi:hypothetical protein|nr:DUF4097 domain-containing protein [Treponema sp.]
MTTMTPKTRAAGLLLSLLLAGVPEGHSLEDLPPAHTETVSLEGVDTLSISYGYDAVIVRKSESGDLILREYMSRDRPRYYANVSRTAGTLQIRRGRRPWLPWTWKARLELYLPPSFRGNLRIVNSSGTFHAETDILDCKTIDISVGSGSVLLNRLSAETVSVRVSSGDLDIKGMGGASFISVSSGKLQIGELTGGEHRIKSSSGRTRIGLLRGDSAVEISSGSIAVERALGRMEAHASSGSLTVEDFSGEGSFEMSSGNISLNIRELTGNLRFNLSSGTAEVNIPAGLAFNLDADIRSGKVLVNEDGGEALRVSGSSTALRPFGPSPERTIYARATSGTVVINRR